MQGTFLEITGVIFSQQNYVTAVLIKATCNIAIQTLMLFPRNSLFQRILGNQSHLLSTPVVLEFLKPTDWFP